jgi:hypothetical protein
VQPLALLVLSVVVFALLVQVKLLLAVLFLITALVTIPAIVLQRREAACAPEIVRGPECESQRKGVARLFGTLGLDTIGIALGTLLIILTVLCIRLAGVHLGG